ncbi:MAG TPA: DNA primase [Clostridiales bacterium]|nr:DNA primase [Clostridiales bacterium]
MFSKSWVDDLKNQINIVDIVKGYVNLRRDGSDRFEACCPFHSEKTPSFKIFVKDQNYHCFGCGKGGDVITFIMEKENFTYVEALKYLAEKYNIPLPKINSMSNDTSEYSKLYEINKEAARFYSNNLLKNKDGLAYKYLISRGINEPLMIKFGLGYSPGYEDLRNYLESKGYSNESMIKAGLLNQKFGDMFAFRLIIPIIDYRSRVIGFGGRAIRDDHQPKYKNSNNNFLFNKSKTLYNINSIRKKGKKENDFIILVEGYMDVISLAKHNILNCVASMGTALTLEQSKQIKKYSDKVYVCFDGDNAGQNAALSAIDILKQSGLEVFVISLPDGKDPDEHISSFGVDAFNKAIKNADALINYKLRIIKNKHNIETSYGKEMFAKEAIKILENLNPIEQESAVKQISEISQFSTKAIFATFEEYANKENVFKNNTQNTNQTIVKDKEENKQLYEASILVLSKFFLNNIDFADINAIKKEYFNDINLIEIFEYLKKVLNDEEKREIRINDIFQISRDKNLPKLHEIANSINELNQKSLDLNVIKQQYHEGLKFLEKNYYLGLIDFYKNELKLNKTPAEKEKLEKLIKEAIQKIR